ncbi:MAG: Transcriptional activator protein NhaR [Verrucomicrobiae bacterium]|nr:Transcriptional activator protein NhaR [Verrucomicrobiae bacterium]
MEWLNYHHLRYFYVVAKEGSLAQAAEKLKVSQPSISTQLANLEEALGVELFRRSGRRKVLTDAGQLVLGYADEIFQLGQELLNAVKSRPGSRALRLYVGVADSFPKLLTNEILKPVFSLPQPVHVICREGKLEDLLGQLAAHRLDIVLADEAAPSSVNIRVFSHRLTDCAISVCALPALARRLKSGFPRSLHGAPALLPTENTGLRRVVEKWFHDLNIRPQVVAEFEDSALLKAVAADGNGFIVLPSLVLEEAVKHYRFRVIGQSGKCRVEFFAITADRRLSHPAVRAITTPTLKPLSL